MSSFLQQWVARLCLGLLLLGGLVPAQGMVLCVEADGCLSFEFKVPDAGCGSCEGHVESNGELQAGLPAQSGLECPCIDVELRANEPGTRVQSRAAQWQIGGFIAPAPEGFDQGPLHSASTARAVLRATPRVADGLTHLCSVILQV